jgi:hypothetical protein
LHDDLVVEEGAELGGDGRAGDGAHVA